MHAKDTTNGKLIVKNGGKVTGTRDNNLPSGQYPANGVYAAGGIEADGGSASGTAIEGHGYRAGITARGAVTITKASLTGHAYRADAEGVYGINTADNTVAVNAGGSMYGSSLANGQGISGDGSYIIDGGSVEGYGKRTGIYANSMDIKNGGSVKGDSETTVGLNIVGTFDITGAQSRAQGIGEKDTGIWAGNAINIAGGTVTARGGSYGLESSGTLSITGGTVTATASGATKGYGNGIYAVGTLNIDLPAGASVTASGKVGIDGSKTTGGAVLSRDSISIGTDTDITTPAIGKVSEFDTNSYENKYAVTDASGTIATDVVVKYNGEADKSALAEAIVKAEALKQADYTGENWAAMQTALAEAKAVHSDNSLKYLDQFKIDAATKKLNDAMGALVKKVQDDKEIKKPYYANIKDWAKENGHWTATDEFGDKILGNWGWDASKQTWYYFDKDGSMKKAEWVKTKDRYGKYHWYHLDRNGKMETGWAQLDGEWYYFDIPDGNMRTGWIQLKGKWYWLRKNGTMATGYEQVSKRWSRFSNSGVWQGYAKNTGWKKYSKGWSFRANGSWAKSKWLQINGKWYAFDNAGYMRTGWVQSGGKWYWLKSSGVMVTSDTTIAGKVNRFDSSGKWLGAK